MNSKGDNVNVKTVERVYLRIVTAVKGGEFNGSEDTLLDSKKLAMDEADRMQREFDEDSEPVRVYVLDEFRVPIYAGGQTYTPSHERSR